MRLEESTSLLIIEAMYVVVGKTYKEASSERSEDQTIMEVLDSLQEDNDITNILSPQPLPK